MKDKNTVIIFIGLLIILIFGVQSVYAQELQPTPSDDEVNAVARELYCPVCENVSLDVCNTQACVQWRELIREQLSEGKQPEEIQQYFAENYGDRVLAEPPLHGLNWLIYVLPVVTLLVGIRMITKMFRTKKIEPRKLPAPTKEEILYIKKMEDEFNKNKFN
jgi:cytochrome c-type biogenesis protein CcmH